MFIYTIYYYILFSILYTHHTDYVTSSYTDHVQGGEFCQKTGNDKNDFKWFKEDKKEIILNMQ